MIVEQFAYGDRNPAAPGIDLMPDLPIQLRHGAMPLSAQGLVDSGASISVMPLSLGVQLGFDWDSEKTIVTLAGTLANVEAKGIVIEGLVGQLPPVRLAFAWAKSDQVPLLLGQFNFFQEFEIVFLRAQGVFEIKKSGSSSTP